MIMASETWRRVGIGVIVAAVIANSVFATAALSGAKGEASTNYVQLQDLGNKTDQCVQQDVRTDGPACQVAAQKAAEVKAAPEQTVTVTVPRRTDAEIRKLIGETIREDPSLVPKGKDGKDAELTDEVIARIVDTVQGRIIPPKDGADGKDAVIDYDKIVTAVLSKVPTPKDGTSPACLDTPQKCVGDTGSAGADGRGIISHDYRVMQYGDPPAPTCVEHNEYTKDPTVQEFPVNPALCTG